MIKAVLVTVILSAPAAASPDAGVACVELGQRLSSTQRSLSSCAENLRTQSNVRERCEAELDEVSGRLAASSAKVESCVQAKEQQCQEVASFAASVLEGNVRGAAGCVAPETQARLQALATAWFSLSRSVAQLDDYATGVSDQLPRTSLASEPERHLARVLGLRTGTPLWNRRLLIEAFKLTAPSTWARLKGQGAVAIDGFFDSRGPLPESFIAEVNGEHAAEPVGPAGPPLTAALRLALSYLHLASCETRPESRECGRARQLVKLLDDTGPLIVRRRVEEMWATPCESLNADAVRAWLQDFPTSRSKEKQAAVAQLASAAKSKLFLCYLGDDDGDASYAKWVERRMPTAAQLEPRALPVVDDFTSFVHEGDAIDRCGRAVRAMQRLEVSGCSIERAESLATINAWAHVLLPADASPDAQVCQKIATLLWSGEAIEIPASPAEQVHVDKENETKMAQLRAACDERRGVGAGFEHSLLALAGVAKALGEPVSASPWRLDVTGTRPLEKARIEQAHHYGSWLQHLVSQETACEAAGLPRARCETCRQSGEGRYDCELTAELEETWSRYRRLTVGWTLGLVGLAVVALWLRGLERARRVFGRVMETAQASFEGLGIVAQVSPWRLVRPSRHDTLRLELPRTPSWERWGTAACAVLSPGTSALREAEVNHAAAVALRHDTRVVFLLHPDSAVPDLGAVRSMLDWAARGGTRAVQVLPMALSRLAWATRDEDLLDLVESTTLRGNPFEVRGPVRSSSQFWNRERLVAGLLAEARAGHWVVVTGLRRFGKSSLALEVARRITGPSAYVDLAGFHHEVSFGETPSLAVEAILRTLVMRLTDSAAASFPAAVMPPVPEGALDAPALAGWLKALGAACGSSSANPPPPMLLVLDEVEQLLSAPPEKLGRALDVLATLTGRLRSAFSEPSSPHAGSTVAVVWCAAMHPLLWAPLATLGGQSIMGAFPSICVPALDSDAAHAMMRGLGARQGIRFEDDALAALVKASHGVPLLLRRLGTSVLELYDADRARQGALGAVRVGIEGAREAIGREQRGGSPLRVWVESEIAQGDTAAGQLLRAVAQGNQVPVASLHKLMEAQVMERFTASGLTAHLSPAELKRRAQEAAIVMVRLLAESRLLESHGDMTAPEAYSLPDGVLRAILTEGQRG